MSSESYKDKNSVQELRGPPNVEVSSESLPRSKLEKKFPGWRLGVLSAFAAVSTILLFNVIFTIWAEVSSGVIGGIGTIFEGTCGKSKSISLWLHLAINIFSTILLAGSNYCEFNPLLSG